MPYKNNDGEGLSKMSELKVIKWRIFLSLGQGVELEQFGDDILTIVMLIEIIERN